MVPVDFIHVDNLMRLGPEEGLKQAETIKTALPVQLHRPRPAQVQVQRVTKVQPKVESWKDQPGKNLCPVVTEHSPEAQQVGRVRRCTNFSTEDSFAAGCVSR